jgi:hypothetical protein
VTDFVDIVLIWLCSIILCCLVDLVGQVEVVEHFLLHNTPEKHIFQHTGSQKQEFESFCSGRHESKRVDE